MASPPRPGWSQRCLEVESTGESPQGPKLEILYWQALYAPAGMPKKAVLIETLNAALQEAVSSWILLTVIKTWDSQGFFYLSQGNAHAGVQPTRCSGAKSSAGAR